MALMLISTLVVTDVQEFNLMSFFSGKRGPKCHLSSFRGMLDFFREVDNTEGGSLLEATKHLTDFLIFPARPRNCFPPILPSFANAATLVELQVGFWATPHN